MWAAMAVTSARRPATDPVSPEGLMRIDILTRGRDEMNAIETASSLLAEALGNRGHETRLAKWEPGRLADSSQASDVLVLPYNPFMWGRWGYAPALARDVTAVRRRRPRPKIVLVVHEPYVPIRDPQSLVMSAWQRAQLGLILLLADRRFASIEIWAQQLSRIRPTAHLPSGSNVPDVRAERAAVRRELGLEDAFVIATLSTGHPSHLISYVEAVLAQLAREVVDSVFLQLGAGAADVALPASVRTERPGLLPAERLGALVGAADLLLTPFVDGVSTRRGSFMAGLCEEVAVLGTRGPLTDPMLLSRGLELIDVRRPDLYAERASELAVDDESRTRAARAGRALFEAEFTWDAIAARLIDGVAFA
jgi:glycosyltransferase involved in cell wall biosynthesis